MQKALASEGTKSQERALEEVLTRGSVHFFPGVTLEVSEFPYVTGAKRRWRKKVAARMALREGN